MLPIKPHLWFDNNVVEAANFYTGLMPDSAVIYSSTIPMPGGSCDVVEFTIAGQPFLGINGGPGLKINPSISFMMHFDEASAVDPVWEKLIAGGKIMMPLDQYPFSARYGWVEDQFGVSWQLMLRAEDSAERTMIMPSMMFTGAVAGKAGEAIDFYSSIFKDARSGSLAPRTEDAGPDKAGSLMYGDFFVHGTWIAAMDSAHPHGFGFNDALSFLITCDSQEEIDYYWSALTAGGTPGQCGWLKDQFGVSWQVASSVMFEALKHGSEKQIERVVEAFRMMEKVEVAVLEEAYRGGE